MMSSTCCRTAQGRFPRCFQGKAPGVIEMEETEQQVLGAE